MTETVKAEKAKRLDGMKMAKPVELLTKSNVANPQIFTHKNTPATCMVLAKVLKLTIY